MLTVWPFHVGVSKLPLCLSVCVHRPPRTRQRSLSSTKTSLSLQFSVFLSFSQFLHRLPVSAPLCLPIYQRHLLSWLLGAGVGERWKRCLIARKNLQLCFILYRTGCCSCRCRSASAAASHQIFSPPHKKTCYLYSKNIRPDDTKWGSTTHTWLIYEFIVKHPTWTGPLFNRIVILNRSAG